MKKIKYYNSMRFQLLMIVIFLIILPLLIIGTLLSNTIKDIFNDKYSAVALQSVQETGEKINFMLTDIQDFSTSMLSNTTFLELMASPISTSKQMDDALRSFLASRNNIDGISVINAKGTYVIGTNKTNPLISIQQLAKEQGDGKPTWFGTQQQNIRILSGVFSRYYFSLVRNVIDFNTLENYGTLVIDIEEVLLEQAYANLNSTGGEVFIVDSEGYIVSHADKRFIGQSITPFAFAETLLNLENDINEIYYTEAHEERVAFYSTLSANNWRIVKTISTDELFFEINQIQRFFLLGGGIYGALIMMFLLSFAVQYTEPMLKIIEDIKRVENGDLSIRTKVDSNNEILQLSDGINNMISEMEVLIDKLVQEERMKREVELEALHAQINPHFLYNTLNTIKWMAKIQGAHSVSNAIVALVKLLRISINISSDFITLEEEITYIQNYVVIQKLRFNEDFEVHYHIERADLQALIPKLILQPIIENSIIYGMEQSTLLKIDIFSTHDEKADILTLKIVDNGPGIAEDKLSQIIEDLDAGNKLSKAGLNNINQRIKLFCGETYGLELLTSESNGTTVMVRLPLKKV